VLRLFLTPISNRHLQKRRKDVPSERLYIDFQPDVCCILDKDVPSERLYVDFQLDVCCILDKSLTCVSG
jgi:hypothetical protein